MKSLNSVCSLNHWNLWRIEFDRLGEVRLNSVRVSVSEKRVRVRSNLFSVEICWKNLSRPEIRWSNPFSTQQLSGSSRISGENVSFDLASDDVDFSSEFVVFPSKIEQKNRLKFGKSFLVEIGSICSFVRGALNRFSLNFSLDQRDFRRIEFISDFVARKNFSMFLFAAPNFSFGFSSRRRTFFRFGSNLEIFLGSNFVEAKIFGAEKLRLEFSARQNGKFFVFRQISAEEKVRREVFLEFSRDETNFFTTKISTPNREFFRAEISGKNRFVEAKTFLFQREIFSLAARRDRFFETKVFLFRREIFVFCLSAQRISFGFLRMAPLKIDFRKKFSANKNFSKIEFETNFLRDENRQILHNEISLRSSKLVDRILFKISTQKRDIYLGADFFHRNRTFQIDFRRDQTEHVFHGFFDDKNKILRLDSDRIRSTTFINSSSIKSIVQHATNNFTFLLRFNQPTVIDDPQISQVWI